MYIIRDGKKEHKISRTYEFDVEYKDVKDSKKLKLRSGDIIKIPEYGYYGKKIRREMAVVLNRYKRIKTTPNNTYVDYGAEFMMISGQEKGKIKKKLGLPTYTKLMRY